MNERSKIKIELSIIDKVFELLGLLALIAIWVLLLMNYSNLPDTIPTHFNGFGEIDAFGTKRNILVLPILATVFYIVLTLVNKVPYLLNYPVTINKENVLRIFTHTTKLVRFLKLVLVVILGQIEYKTIQIAHGEAEGLGVWFLPYTLGFTLIPIIFFAVKIVKDSK